MKIKLVIEDYEDRTGSSMEILIDDKAVFQVHDGEPEDNSLSRNFNDCYKIQELLVKAYNAGKNNEQLEIEE